MWVPPSVSRAHADETVRREQEALRGLVDESRWNWVKEFNRDLEHVWPGMRLLWCPDPAPLDAVAMGARPGRWGILMPSQTGGPGSVKPLISEDGGFVEPGGWVFDMLREQDWWNPEVRRERDRVKQEAKRTGEKRRQEEREKANEEVLERFLAGTRTQVSMNRDTPWAQNASGYRRIRGTRKAA